MGKFVFFIVALGLLGILTTNHANASCPSACSCVKSTLGETVTCIGSSIVSFPQGIPPTTKSFELHRTNVTRIPVDAFKNQPNLEAIYITSNKKLHTLPTGIFNSTNLKELFRVNLNYNRLTRLPGNLFNNLPKLSVVHLNDNDLSALPSNIFRNLPKFRELEVEENELTSVPENLFDNSMKEFKYVSFASNQLSNLPDNIFTPVSNSLESLYVDTNQFRFPPMKALRKIGKQFLEINFHRNPTYCNCSLAEFAIWAKDVIHEKGVTCNGVNVKLENINLTHCELPTTSPPTTTSVPSTTTRAPTTTEAPTTTKLTTTTKPSGNLTITKEPSTAKEASTTQPPSTSKQTPSTKQKEITTIPERTTESSTEAPTTTRRKETTKFTTLTTEISDTGDVETQDTSDENERRKKVIIAVSIAAVAFVVLLSVVFCLFHTGILSTRRFRKDKVVIFDSEGRVLVTEKEGAT